MATSVVRSMGWETVGIPRLPVHRHCFGKKLSFFLRQFFYASSSAILSDQAKAHSEGGPDSVSARCEAKHVTLRKEKEPRETDLCRRPCCELPYSTADTI